MNKGAEREFFTVAGTFWKRVRFREQVLSKGQTIMKGYHEEKRLDTTLGELIEAVSEVAFEYCTNTKEAYALASLVLGEMLKGGSSPVEEYIGTSGQRSTRKIYLH